MAHGEALVDQRNWRQEREDAEELLRPQWPVDAKPEPNECHHREAWIPGVNALDEQPVLVLMGEPTRTVEHHRCDEQCDSNDRTRHRESSALGSKQDKGDGREWKDLDHGADANGERGAEVVPA